MVKKISDQYVLTKLVPPKLSRNVTTSDLRRLEPISEQTVQENQSKAAQCSRTTWLHGEAMLPLGMHEIVLHSVVI